MSADRDQAEFDMTLDPAEAFEGMRRRLALLAAAVEGFASRQERIDARDYTSDLARLIERQEQLADAFVKLRDRPALALTPERMAAEIVEAGRDARKADHQLIETAASQQRSATQALETIIGHARTREKQVDAMIWAWIGGVLTVLPLLFVVV